MLKFLKWEEAIIVYHYFNQIGSVQIENDYDLMDDHVILNFVIHVSETMYHEVKILMKMSSALMGEKEVDINKIKDRFNDIHV